MKRIILLSTLFVFALMGVSLQAQTEKKIVIKKKVVDANGNVSEEEITLEGEEAEAFDMDKYLEGQTGKEVDINIEKSIEDGQEGNTQKEIRKEIRILKIDGTNDTDVDVDELLKNMDVDIEGANKKIIRIEVDGNDFEEGSMENLPEDVQKMLKEKGIEIQEEGKMRILKMDGENSFEFKTDEMEMDGEKIIMKGNTKIKILGDKDVGIEGDDIQIFYMDKSDMAPEDLEKMLERGEGNHTIIWKSKDGLSDEARDFMMGKRRNHCSPCEKWQTITKPAIGIMISPSEKGALVEEVNREDKVLEANDVITQFGKTKISSIDELIEAVSAKEPGDKVKVKFLRNGKVQKAKIKLQSRTEKICMDRKENVETEIIIREGLGQNPPSVTSDSGKRKLELKNFELFPNPSNGTFRLNFVSSDNGPISIIVNDTAGKEILRDEINDFDGNFQGEFNLKGNAPGVYFLNIQQDGSITTEKIILK